MKRGDKVQVLGVLTEDGEPMPCHLEGWHPNPYAKKYGTEGEWDYATEDGRHGCRAVDEITPWQS